MCIHYFKDKDLAKDNVLEIFEKLFTELRKREVENFKGWLTFVVRNHCISELRKMQTRTNRDLDYCYEMKSAAEEEERDPAEEEKKLKVLEKAMRDLNPLQRTCIELFYLKDMSYSQIVETTGYPINEVKSYIQNGKRNLKLMLINTK
jgi:RNA polymerase sigma-70 factor (ECF subfamily)